MKKLAILLTIMLMTVVTADAKSEKKGLFCLKDMQYVSYIQVDGRMLQSGLYLSQYGITSAMTENLRELQIVVIPASSPDLDKCRKLVHQLVKDMDRPLDMSTSQSNITVWGNANKNNVYGKAVIGIGSQGKLSYIYMEGEVTGSTIGAFISAW